MWNFSRRLAISAFMLDILTAMNIHICWPDYFDRILLDYILILLETSFVGKLHSHVCHCPVQLVL
jgi:hypothetical protein